MLHLITHLAGQAYAIEAARIAEVLPIVELQRPPGPEHLATFRLRGRVVPAVDVSLLLLGRPVEARLNTRILMIGRRAEEAVGIVCENVTQTVHIDETSWQPVRRPGEPAHLGPAVVLSFGAVRRLEINALLEAALGGLALPG